MWQPIVTADAPTAETRMTRRIPKYLLARHRKPVTKDRVTPVLFVAVALFTCSPAHSEITLDGVARSASLFTALAVECSNTLKINLNKAKRYEQAYIEAGKNAFGKKRFMAALRREDARRAAEVKITGRAQWCTYQRAHVEKIGAGDVFIHDTDVISADDMADLLSSLVVTQSECGFNASDAPLAPVVGRHGLKLEDFMPNGRYDPIMEAKMIKIKDLLRQHEKTCDSLVDAIRRSLPELVRGDNEELKKGTGAGVTSKSKDEKGVSSRSHQR
jgi:hypothetical protein